MVTIESLLQECVENLLKIKKFLNKSYLPQHRDVSHVEKMVVELFHKIPYHAIKSVIKEGNNEDC